MPIVSDWWQHEFNQIEHIAHVHAVYGERHLQHEITETGSDNGHNYNQTTLKSVDQVAFHVLANAPKFDFISILSDKQFESLNYLKPLPVFIVLEVHPPSLSNIFLLLQM